MNRKQPKAAAIKRAKAIKKMMVDLGWNSTDLANRMDIKPATVRKLLNGERTTMRRYDEMEQILKAHLSGCACNNSQTA